MWKSFWVLKFGHSVNTRRKIINKVFTILFWDTLCLILLKVHNPLVMVISKVTSISQEVFYCNSVTWATVSITAVKILEMYLSGIYLNSFEKPFSSNTFLSTFYPICRTQIYKTRLGGCFWKVLSHFNWPSTFVHYIQLSCNKIFI